MNLKLPNLPKSKIVYKKSQPQDFLKNTLGRPVHFSIALFRFFWHCARITAVLSTVGEKDHVARKHCESKTKFSVQKVFFLALSFLFYPYIKLNYTINNFFLIAHILLYSRANICTSNNDQMKEKNLTRWIIFDIIICGYFAERVEF